MGAADPPHVAQVIISCLPSWLQEAAKLGAVDSVRCLDQASQGEGQLEGSPSAPGHLPGVGRAGVGEGGKREEGRGGGRGQGRGGAQSCLLLASESELQLKS